jgi:hypothetical protein
MGWMVNGTPRPLHPWEWAGTHCMGGQVDPRAGLDGCGKPPPPEFDPPTAHPVGNRYTNWAIPVHVTHCKSDFNQGIALSQYSLKKIESENLLTLSFAQFCQWNWYVVTWTCCYIPRRTGKLEVRSQTANSVRLSRQHQPGCYVFII